MEEGDDEHCGDLPVVVGVDAVGHHAGRSEAAEVWKRRFDLPTCRLHRASQIKRHYRVLHGGAGSPFLEWLASEGQQVQRKHRRELGVAIKTAWAKAKKGEQRGTGWMAARLLAMFCSANVPLLTQRGSSRHSGKIPSPKAAQTSPEKSMMSYPLSHHNHLHRLSHLLVWMLKTK